MNKSIEIINKSFDINEYFKEHSQEKLQSFVYPKIVCKDGFEISVQAGFYNYSSPRSDVDHYVKVELGFPSESIESIKKYAEDSENLTETVYGQVPIEIINDLINSRGGLK